MQKQFSLQEHIQIARATGLDMCVLDSALKCVYSEGVLNVGDRLTDMLHKRIELPVRSCANGCVTVRDSFYCVRIFPLCEDISHEHYLCEVLDGNSVIALADNTDIAISTSAAFSAMKYRAYHAKELCEILRRYPSYDVQEMAVELFARIDRLGVVIDRFAAYSELHHTSSRKLLFDVCKLCERLCVRCNTALSGYGRAIAMPLYDEPLYICADGRYSVIAFLYMIYNALLFSSDDSMPQPIIHRAKGEGNVVVRILDIPAGKLNISGDAQVRFALVRRYAEAAGGCVELAPDGSAVSLTVPAATADQIAMCRLEEALDVMYDAEINRQLCALAAECEMTANVQ